MGCFPSKESKNQVTELNVRPVSDKKTISESSGSTAERRKPIVHIVLFQFKDGVPPEEVKEMSNGMATLDTKLFHPTTGKNYVKNRIGGVNNSPEGRPGGMTHGYICEFDNEEDRHYYLNNDENHKEWVKKIKPYIAGAQVIDFVDGVHVREDLTYHCI